MPVRRIACYSHERGSQAELSWSVSGCWLPVRWSQWTAPFSVPGQHCLTVRRNCYVPEVTGAWCERAQDVPHDVVVEVLVRQEVEHALRTWRGLPCEQSLPHAPWVSPLLVLSEPRVL